MKIGQLRKVQQIKQQLKQHPSLIQQKRRNRVIQFSKMKKMMMQKKVIIERLKNNEINQQILIGWFIKEKEIDISLIH